MIDEIKKCVSYNPDTGKFTWIENLMKPKNWNTRFSGKEAFLTKDKFGYLYGRVNYKRMLAHRVAWAMHYGKWPDCHIDHINGDKGDNRIANLRDVSISENQWNRKDNKNNTSGYKGVYWSSKDSRWISNIHVGGKKIILGYFSSKVDAHNEYQKATLTIHKGFYSRP